MRPICCRCTVVTPSEAGKPAVLSLRQPVAAAAVQPQGKKQKKAVKAASEAVPLLALADLKEGLEVGNACAFWPFCGGCHAQRTQGRVLYSCAVSHCLIVTLQEHVSNFLQSDYILFMQSDRGLDSLCPRWLASFCMKVWSTPQSCQRAWGSTRIQQLQNNHLTLCSGSSAASTHGPLLLASGEGLCAQREPCRGLCLPL